MISTQSFHYLQAKTKVISDGIGSSEEVPFETYVTDCQLYLQKSLPSDLYTKGSYTASSREVIKNNIITEFVDAHKVNVQGYVLSDGSLNLDALLTDTLQHVGGIGILKEAFDDPDIDEIQINDINSIFVSRRGILQPYLNKQGREYHFSSNEELIALLARLTDDNTGNSPKMSEGRPLFNAKTAKEQYRVNAVHSIANATDKPPYNQPITSVVIRKFKEVKLQLGDLVESGGITDKIARFIQMISRAECKIFCVGPTASGKTTLLNIVANVVPEDRRIILVQNPTEISIFDRTDTGRNRRNAVHWEVADGKFDTEDVAPTMENLISNTLRASPEIILVGEARTPAEFAQIRRAALTGHRVLGTFHAEDEEDAVYRFADELATASGSSQNECLTAAARAMNIVLSQYRFGDGTRKIMGISEVVGIKNGEPVLNPIFKYELTGEMLKNKKNGLNHAVGHFKYCNPITKRLEQAFYKAGISREDIYDFISEGYSKNKNAFDEEEVDPYV